MSSWKLNKREVSQYGGSSRNFQNRKTARQPRSFDKSSLEMNLVHIHTKIEVHGEIKGNFSRKEMTASRKALYEQLFKELEDKVAKHLHIKGR